ncbi:hypothetical protein pb186bvf_017438 [Paramecium bursaria]
MNPKDFFDFSHYRLTPVYPPESLQPLINFNKNTWTEKSASQNKVHSLNKPSTDPIYYVQDEKIFQVGKKETQQGTTFTGYIIYYLVVTKYKGMIDLDSLAIETNLESLKKNKVYRVLSQYSYDSVKDNQEMFLYNESKIEDQDEYSLSYNIHFRSNQQFQEAQRIEKKQQYSFKAFQPFESHYSMVTDNFPDIYLEYSCQNTSELILEMKHIEFKVDKSMEIQRLKDHPVPLILQKEECYKIIYKIKININNVQNVLTQKKDQTEYDLKLGHIFLQWGNCGNYEGTQKTCLVRLYPINPKIIGTKELAREIITSITVQFELGMFTTNLDIQIKLDDMDMKNIKIIGISQTVFECQLLKRNYF